MATNPEHDVELVIFSTLSILQIIKDAQQQHGLRHGDYMRYRQYCARRIRRVRKSLHFVNAHKSGLKSAAKYTSKPVTDDVATDVKYLLIPLFDAERCWSYAQQLKHDQSMMEADGQQARHKFHMSSKLRKAVKHADALYELCNALPQVDSASKLESQAYQSWMHGQLHFEGKQWAKAAECFKKAQSIYSQLSEVITTPVLVALYKVRCQEMQPQLRYCAYEGGDTSAMDDLKKLNLNDDINMDINKLILSTRDAKAAAAKAEIKWMSHTISVAHPPSVASLQTTMTQLPAQLLDLSAFDDKLAVYEGILGDCRDAIQAVREMAKGETLSSRATAEDMEEVKLSTNQLLHSYLSSKRLEFSNARWLLMLQNALSKETSASGAKKTKQVDMVRIYDNLLANTMDMRDMPGITAVRVDELRVQEANYMAHRCAHVAAAYAHQKKWAEALAMYDRTQVHIDSAQHIDKSSYAELVATVNSGRYSCAAQRLLVNTGGDKAPKETESVDGALLSQPARYHAALNMTDVSSGKLALIRIPTNYVPMPTKPLFFDLAVNHIQFPSLDDKMEQPKADKPAASSAKGATAEQPEEGGIGGVLTGWFWGAKK